MWDIHEVIDGECAGKFIILSILGLPANDNGEVLYFDTIDEASAHIEKMAGATGRLIAELAERK